MNDQIVVHGAREHNLKNIDLHIPKNKLVVFTGLSGSGKSSMAFDTIYAEGQRRYVESLSSYARQFLGVMDKPDVDQIDGLSPAISIDQKSASHNPRSTVGTVTEIYDYLRLLYARIGHPHCPLCGREIVRLSNEQIVNNITSEIENLLKIGQLKIVKFIIFSPVIRDRKGEFLDLFSSLRQKGYTQVRADGKIIGLDEDISLLKNNKHSIDVVIDRLVVDKIYLRTSHLELRTRLFEAIETATKLSEGLCIFSRILDKTFDMPQKPALFEDHLFSQKFSCPVDNFSFPEIEPRLFSFNSPHGACPTCTGLGTLLKIEEKLILNRNLTISEGGVLPYANTFSYDSWFAQKVAQFLPIRIPIKEFSSKQLNLLLFGSKSISPSIRLREGDSGGELFTKSNSSAPNSSFEGIIPNLERRYKQTESDFIRNEIEKYMRKEICPECNGLRLKKEALSITIQNKSISQLTSFSISQTLEFLKTLSPSTELKDREHTISAPILKEITSRLGFLNSVGLEYLTLDRTAATLAGGESQRIRLASQIGSGLSGVLYVLDEPSIGLHQRDNGRLISTLQKLRDLGNSVIVVEHDREMMESADWIVDFGPGAGEHGGNLVAEGTYSQIIQNPKSLTGQYLSGQKTISLSNQTNKLNTKLIISGASEHNLKNITVEFPLGKFICIAGVSGSGKSTLLIDILYQALAGKFNPDHKEKPGKYENIYIKNLNDSNDDLINFINRVILVDQSPIGRTPRSNPATYTGLFTHIRELFAMTPEAKVRGYLPGRFSFNVKGGRCENCQGDGQIKIEMQFLPDVYVNCEVCKGTRYNSESLEVHFKGKNIAEVLGLSVEEALEFFKSIPAAVDKLQTLKDVGLEYIRLGQPAPSLSGGEAQRVKLASELSKRATGKTVYILDEPTTGLHFADLQKLLVVLQRLVSGGNTVIVIEHNLDVIKNADWIIELGPEGGDNGGYVVAAGTPSQIAKIPKSPTGKYL
jgi:excinuclease ABC subunit A